eukprot:648464-Amorphochlora_amoeboformis.AAC.1
MEMRRSVRSDEVERTELRDKWRGLPDLEVLASGYGWGYGLFRDTCSLCFSIELGLGLEIGRSKLEWGIVDR